MWHWFEFDYVQYGLTLQSVTLEKSFLLPSLDSVRVKKKRVFKNYLRLFVSRHSGCSLEENYFQRISLSYSTPATWQSTIKTVHFWLMKNGEENKQVEKKSHLQRKSRKEMWSVINRRESFWNWKNMKWRKHAFWKYFIPLSVEFSSKLVALELDWKKKKKNNASEVCLIPLTHFC